MNDVAQIGEKVLGGGGQNVASEDQDTGHWLDTGTMCVTRSKSPCGGIHTHPLKKLAHPNTPIDVTKVTTGTA